MKPRLVLEKIAATLARLGEAIVFQPLIENGVTVSEASFPFLAKLINEQANKLTVMCAGIALDERWVLTAGHCASLVPVTHVRPAGTFSLFTFQRHLHPDFTGSTAADTRNDLALLRVDGTLPQHWDISRIFRTADIPGSSSFVAFGWGRPRTNSANPALRRSKLLAFQPAATCEALYSQTIQASNELCVGRQSMSPCRYDSGGPLFTASGSDENPVLGSLVGIVSKADGDCSNSGPAVFSAFDDTTLQWIRDRNDLVPQG